jgi:4'-phosphopantetheinyl transferase
VANELAGPAPGAVHVWYVDLDGDPPAGTDAGACLDAAERDRAGRLLRDTDRARYVASHCATRHLLAPYLDCAPAEIRVSRACVHCGDPKHGKPVLTPPSGELVVEINISHSGSLAAVAVARPPLRVGVDVELRRPNVDWAHILPGGPPATDADGFTAWTRIEAVTKAAGTGIISMPTIAAGAGEWAQATLPKDGGSWQVRSLEPPAGYAAALAASERPGEVSVRWFR